MKQLNTLNYIPNEAKQITCKCQANNWNIWQKNNKIYLQCMAMKCGECYEIMEHKPNVIKKNDRVVLTKKGEKEIKKYNNHIRKVSVSKIILKQSFNKRLKEGKTFEQIKEKIKNHEVVII